MKAISTIWTVETLRADGVWRLHWLGGSFDNARERMNGVGRFTAARIISPAGVTVEQREPDIDSTIKHQRKV